MAVTYAPGGADVVSGTMTNHQPAPLVHQSSQPPLPPTQRHSTSLLAINSAASGGVNPAYRPHGTPQDQWQPDNIIVSTGPSVLLLKQGPEGPSIVQYEAAHPADGDEASAAAGPAPADSTPRSMREPAQLMGSSVEGGGGGLGGLDGGGGGPAPAVHAVDGGAVRVVACQQAAAAEGSAPQGASSSQSGRIAVAFSSGFYG